MNPRDVDVVIVGTGQAAVPLAVALASRGETVMVFEGGLPGGSCVNVGCTPTKTLRKSARVAHMARRAAEFGVHVGDVEVDFAAAMERAERVVRASREGLIAWMNDADGVTLVPEWARFDGRARDRFIVRGRTQAFAARRVYLNTGTRPALPTIDGLTSVPYLTNETVMSLRERPQHVIVLGGSYIGLEMGQILRRLGSEVTIIEHAGAVAEREDADVSASIREMLEAEGIRVMTSTDVVGVQSVGGAGGAQEIVASTQTVGASSSGEVRGSHLLIATGRAPNTRDLALDTVGVQCDERGFVTVNGQLESSVAGIFALGDINRRGAFTHTSYQDHEIVLDNLRGGSRTADGRVITYAMYTDPPLGRVGMNARDAQSLIPGGRRFLTASHDMAKVSRAKEEGETTGVLRVLVDADSERFVGATLLGINADEIVQVVGAMMAADVSYRVLKDALPVHPTVAEFFPTLLGKLEPLAAS